MDWDDDLLEFVEFLDDLATEADQEHENDTESETEGNVNCPINRLMPFYERRKDIFDMFDDEQVVRTFRFDKQTIFYITGLVKEGLPQRHTKCEHKLLPVDQVLLALQFFETGTFQSVVANVLVSGLLDVPSMLFPMLSVAQGRNISLLITPIWSRYKEILLKLPTCKECSDTLTEPTFITIIITSRPHAWENALSIARDITRCSRF